MAMKTKKKTRRAARLLLRLCMVDGVLDEARARQVAARLAASGRRGALPVASEFLRLVRLDIDRRTALVESAMPLPADVGDDVSARLAGTYGPGVKATFALNPALGAGIRIKIGSQVYDGSVRGRLAALEARL
jgi:F-type H+-transporting ATPase subunit delta